MKWDYEPKTHSTMYALHSLAQHLVENEAFIRRAAEEDVSEYGPKWSPRNEAEQAEFSALQDDVRLIYTKIMTPIHRYSCVVMLATTVERELRRLIDNLDQKPGQQMVETGRNSYLAKVARFLKTYHALDIMKCPQYQDLCELQKIRNCIAHCRGELALVRLEQDREHLKNLESKGYGFFATPQITIDAQCIQHFLLKAWAFFAWVFATLQWRIEDHYQKHKLGLVLNKLTEPLSGNPN